MALLQLHSAPIDVRDGGRDAVIEVDRINVGLALVNWCVLLLLMCGLLLAKTLPSDSQLTSGFADEDCKASTKVCQDVKTAKSTKSTKAAKGK